MKQRIITGILFGIVTLALLLGNQYSRLVFVLLVPFLAGMEYSKITQFKLLDYITSGVTIGIAILIGAKYQFGIIIITLISIFVAILLGFNLFAKAIFIKHAKWKTILLSTYIVFPFIAYYFSNYESENPYFLLHLIILIWVSDSSAYFVGSQIGKRKLFSRISPKKTWEGFLGAGMITLIAAYIIFSITKLNTWGYWVVFGILSWLVSSLGDLVASHVKRIHNVKDSGTFLPGHGGFFDRFDGYIYALPFVLILKNIIELL